MKQITLEFLGVDGWDRPVFKDKNDNIFKDINLGNNPIELYTASHFDGEPDTPIHYIKKYKDVEFIIEGMEEQPTEEEEANYRLLSRLQQDCRYYLGNGNRNTEQLWAEDEEKHIDKMMDLYRGFSDNKKPEWISWGEILEYGRKMVK